MTVDDVLDGLEVESLAVALVGNVGDGKTTLLRGLLDETGTVPGSLVKSDRRQYTFIDAPGPIEFLRNLASRATRVDAAVLLIDATESPLEQTLRQSALLRLIGVRDVVVAVNKMDLCADASKTFSSICEEIAAQFLKTGLHARAFIPMIARDGVNVRSRSPLTSWHTGPTLMEALDAIDPRRDARALPLRLPIQDVYRQDGTRWIAGRIESGSLAAGDEILLSPSGKTARINSLRPATRATAGMNVAVELDTDVFVERGFWISGKDSPPKLTRVFDAEIFWLGPAPLSVGTTLRLAIATSAVDVRVQAIRWVLDADGMSHVQSGEIAALGIGRITVRSDTPFAIDDVTSLTATGRFVIANESEMIGIGVADTSGYPDLRHHAPHASENIEFAPHVLSGPQRNTRYGHPGAVVWLTGLSGAGKSTLAMELERRLFSAGCAVFVLDGDNLRHGLNADLGFAPDDRRENVRRAGEVAALFAEAGLICIVALISPYRDDRDQARAAAGEHLFLEIFVNAPIEKCEARDPKGLYRKARARLIADFTGVDAPYERPEAPDLVVDTGERSVEECEHALRSFISLRLGISG
jgi:bifunctional enzyme CysN/CysC